jgi:hypothetical protein
MIFTDPYCITLIVTERIQRLLDTGHLAEVEPDREYGYTCRAVFGVLTSEIAAIRDQDAGGRQLLCSISTMAGSFPGPRTRSVAARALAIRRCIN